ncbi:MAG: hypothetical protein Q9215_002371 [Flavoplaca cf. flavocitrina]
MIRNKPSKALARLPSGENSGDEVVVQRATAAKDRAHLRNRKHKERVKKNKLKRNQSEKNEPYGYKMRQLRCWMMNEQRRDDKGGITQAGFYALRAWSKEPEGNKQITLAPDAEKGKDRFKAEWEAAAEEQGRNTEPIAWWTRVPSYAERTGQPRPGKDWKKLVRENQELESEGMGLVKRGDDSKNVIVLDDSDEDDENSGKVTSMMEGVEIDFQGGVQREMVLRGPRMPSVGGSGMTTETDMRRDLEESEGDVDPDGGVRFDDQDTKPMVDPGCANAQKLMYE